MIRTMSTALMGMTLLALPIVGRGADEDASARVKEMLHRTQEALRQAQSENADLARAKSDLEQKLQEATAQLETSQTGAKAAQAALSAKLSSTEGSRADLEHKLESLREQLAKTEAQLGTVSKQLAESGLQLKATQASVEQAVAANTNCEAKNLELYGYAQEVLHKYRTKGVWAALSQKEPVFGFKEVDMENVIQEYQAKLEAQRIK